VEEEAKTWQIGLHLHVKKKKKKPTEKKKEQDKGGALPSPCKRRKEGGLLRIENW
jgi:hypothetical protein